MEEVTLDVRVEAGKAGFDDDLMLDAGMQADELVLELDDLQDKEEEYQTVDLDAEPVTIDVEVAAESLEAQSKSNDDQAEATYDVEEGAHDVSMAFNDEIGYEEEEGVAEEATIEDAPKEATTSEAPLANDEKSDHLEAEQEAQDVPIDLAEPKISDIAEEQATDHQAGAANPDEQETAEPAAKTEASLDVDGAVAADALKTAVSRTEQSVEVASEDHQLEESQNDHDEAIADDAAFSITDITVQYDGGSYALFGNEDMDPETYFLSDTEIATAPLSELLASIRSVIASELTPGEELVIVIDSLDLNFGERSSRDFLQRSFHQIIYCYNVLLAKGIVTETSLMLNLVVRPDPEGRFLELLEEAGIWSGADYSPDYSDASVEGEHLDDDQDIEGYDDNEDLENDNDHEHVQDCEFDDQEHQDEDGQQDQEQEENEDGEQQEGLDLTENVEMTEDAEVTDDIKVSADVPETGNVAVSAGTNQDETPEEHTEPQATEDVSDNERDAEQVSLEEDIVQSRQPYPAADINGERRSDAGEFAHNPSGFVDVEHEMEGDLGEAQPNLEGTGSVLEHVSEMKSAADEPQPESGDYTEVINEQEEEEAYNEEEYLEHQEEAEVEEQEDHDIDHAAGAEGLGDDLTLRQTLDDGNFSLDIMEESTEGNAVLDLDDNATGKSPFSFLSTAHNPSTHSHILVSHSGESMDDDLINYTDDESHVHTMLGLKRKSLFPDLGFGAKKTKVDKTGGTMPPLHSRASDNVSGGSQLAVELRPNQHRDISVPSTFRSDSPCTDKSSSPVNFSVSHPVRGGRFHSHKDSDLSVTFSAYHDADMLYQENNDSTSHNPDSAALQGQYIDDGHNMDDYTEVENAVDIEYTNETSHLTINTADSKDKTEEGVHDLTTEELATHTSTTNTMTGDEIDYDEHEEEDGSFEPEDQALESSNAQGDDDEIGWGEDGDEDNSDPTQQTTTSQDQPAFTTKRGRTDDLDEEAEEAGRFNA